VQMVVNAATLVEHISFEINTAEAVVDAAQSDGHSLLFAELAAIRTALRSIPLHQLPGQVVSHVMEVAWAVEQFHTLVDRALNHHGKMSDADYSDFFESLNNLTIGLLATARRLAKVADARLPESVSDWADWTEALGTVTAIFSALGFGLWQQRAQRQRDRASALVVSAAVAPLLRQVLGGLEAIQQDLRGVARGGPECRALAHKMIYFLGSFNMPSPEVILILGHAARDPALRLNLISTLTGQLRAGLQLVVAPELAVPDEHLWEQMRPLRHLAQQAIHQAELAISEMEAFLGLPAGFTDPAMNPPI
jgi:hypothetical protein